MNYDTINISTLTQSSEGLLYTFEALEQSINNNHNIHCWYFDSALRLLIQLFDKLINLSMLTTIIVNQNFLSKMKTKKVSENDELWYPINISTLIQSLEDLLYTFDAPKQSINNNHNIHWWYFDSALRLLIQLFNKLINISLLTTILIN